MWFTFFIKLCWRGVSFERFSNDETEMILDRLEKNLADARQHLAEKVFYATQELEQRGVDS